MNNSGYIALVSAVIISAVLLTLILGTSLTGFGGRFNILDAEFKEQSAALAAACVETAMLKIAANNAYAGGELIPVGDGHCQIDAVTRVGASWKIKAHAQPHNSYTTLCVEIDSSLAVASWRELAQTTDPC